MTDFIKTPAEPTTEAYEIERYNHLTMHMEAYLVEYVQENVSYYPVRIFASRRQKKDEEIEVFIYYSYNTMFYAKAPTASKAMLEAGQKLQDWAKTRGNCGFRDFFERLFKIFQHCAQCNDSLNMINYRDEAIDIHTII